MAAFRKWPTGIYLIWYPLKGREDADRLARRLREVGVEKSLRAELTVAAMPPDGRLQACGVMVINPPWKLAAELAIIGPFLARLLCQDAGRGFKLDCRED
jgi:23S rRNA (adenine2030-N6)-methyltransferase